MKNSLILLIHKKILSLEFKKNFKNNSNKRFLIKNVQILDEF